MELESKVDVKRLVIFFFYDKDGIVDNYIPYMLEDLKKNTNEIFIVCNGKINSEGRKKLTEITDKILIRKNVGFDVWAYKEALEEYGWEELGDYDEIILMNFTMYGPLYPFVEMFNEMDKRDVDFWGITKHHGFSFDPFGTIPCGYIPEHIQSSFIVIRNSMIKSREFHKYWDEMDEVNSYGEAVGKHEAIFTQKFEEYGFVSDVYVNTDDLKKYTHYPLMIEPLELVKNRRCPVFKRKSFCNEYYEFLNCTTGEPTVELYDFIKKELNYDLNLVWDNLLRVENMADIKNRMHLNYILPKEYYFNKKHETKRIALIIHIYFSDLIQDTFGYIENMPKYADIYITTDTEEKKKIIEGTYKKLRLQFNNMKVIIIQNRGRDISSILVGCREYIQQYDYVCFAHDKKTAQFEPYTIGKSFAYKCFENILGSSKYVENIIETFEENQRLGLMMPPPPNHASFYGIFGTEWGENFDNTKELGDKLGLKVNMNIMKEPIAPLGTMFWFRPEALKVLLDNKWKYEDFPEEPNYYDGTILHAVERIYPFVAQHEGYYSAWVMHDKFANIELTNLHFMLREYSMAIYGAIGHQMGFNMSRHNLIEQISFKNVIKIKIKQHISPRLWKVMKKSYLKIKR